MQNKDLRELLGLKANPQPAEQANKAYFVTPVSPGVCPNCGHCPTCGKSRWTSPYIYPQPYTPMGPYTPIWSYTNGQTIDNVSASVARITQ